MSKLDPHASAKYNAEFSKNLQAKFPNKVPVIMCLEKILHQQYELIRNKFLVDGSISVSAFQHTLRKYIKYRKSVSKVIDAEVGIFVFYGTPAINLPRPSDTMGDVFTTLQTNGFLHATILKENTFGWSNGSEQEYSGHHQQ
jgi:hypothetical protein